MSQLPTKVDMMVAVMERAQANGYVMPDIVRGIDFELCLPMVIFSHDFAKAFFGNDEITHVFGIEIIEETWRKELKELVLDKDPLQYLYNFLENGTKN